MLFGLDNTGTDLGTASESTLESIIESTADRTCTMRNWARWDGSHIGNLLQRFNLLSYRHQIDVLVEIELLWNEDLGRPLSDIVVSCVERARDHGLFCAWIMAIERVETFGSSELSRHNL
jgi:hypothetical protein